MTSKIIEKKYDFIVVGGGMAGLCAALASSRMGVKTAIIQNRPVFGGNASSEVKMHICGADNHMTRANARETGIIEEILLENKHRNRSNSFNLFDVLLWEKARFQKNLDIFLNAHMYETELEDNTIKSVTVIQMTNEKQIKFYGDLFVDATGDGTLGYLSGADFMEGKEGKQEFHESMAPEEHSDYTMGSSLQFTSVDTGNKVDYKKPEWAFSFSEEQLKNRDHSSIKDGYWWIEAGGNGVLNTIADSETIRDELYRNLFGVWDHIKNVGEHGSDNYELDWVGALPGKRESRRFVGDYILNANDLLENRSFNDAIAYGGWPMDIHVDGGILSQDEPTIFHHLEEVYSIPYRCLYSKNINNLFLAGRNISASHMAFGSTRVMATCSVMGEAVGLAAYIAIKERILPRQVNFHMNELQQLALKKDLYIPGVKNCDTNDLALTCDVKCSSFEEGYECENIINGIARTVKENSNCWKSVGLRDEWLQLSFKVVKPISTVNLKFDSNLSKEIMLSLSEDIMARQDRNVPKTLVKDFNVKFFLEGTEVLAMKKTDNYLRNVIINLEEPIICDMIRIEFLSTNGVNVYTVFEVRVY